MFIFANNWLIFLNKKEINYKVLAWLLSQEFQKENIKTALVSLFVVSYTVKNSSKNLKIL